MNLEHEYFMDILDKREKFVNAENSKADEELKVETCEEVMAKPIPKIERLINPFVERNGYTLIGGAKGVGKSLFVTQMALYYTSGKSGFLNSTIEKPGKVLLIQQEVSESGMQDRLNKMVSEETFNTKGRFFLKTTTQNQWHLTEEKDLNKVIELIERAEPDILILDPLYTFNPKELNQYKDMSQIVSVLLKLKTKYNLSLVVVHHFSNKENPDQLVSTAGRFMGHSILANAADVAIGLDFLHPRYKDQALPLPYNHYAVVEAITRHSEWPEKFSIERRENRLLFHPSSIWQNIGKKILPDEIVDLIRENGGSMFQSDVIKSFENKAHPNTIRKAIKEAEDKIEDDREPGKHGKKILILKEEEILRGV